MTGRIVRSIAAHEGHVTGVCFSPDGNRLVTAGWDRWKKIWDTESSREILAMKKNVGIYSLAFDPKGRRIALSGHGQPISLYEALSLASPPVPLVLGEPYRPFVWFTEKMKVPVDPARRKIAGEKLLEGETLVTQARTGGDVIIQPNMHEFGGQWSRDKQLLWWHPRKGDTLTLVLPAEQAGLFEVSAGFTGAPEFGTVSLAIEGSSSRTALISIHRPFCTPVKSTSAA